MCIVQDTDESKIEVQKLEEAKFEDTVPGVLRPGGSLI